MNSLVELLNSFWILKSKDRNKFYTIQRDIPKFRKFIQENVGWRILQTDQMLRIEKTTLNPQSFMGIQDFNTIEDYVLFCALLVFLEDMEEKQPFLLSELIAHFEMQLQDVMEIDWTIFSTRRSLIRVLQYAVKMNLLILHEGNLDQALEQSESEVLYENTGLSREFAIHYLYDMSQCESVEDFKNISLSSIQSEIGHFRTNRVYQELLTSPALYWSDTTLSEISYLRHNYKSIQNIIDKYFKSRLDVHRNAAYMVFEDESNEYGNIFPNQTTLHDVILLVCGEIIALHKETNQEDQLILSKKEFHSLIELTQKKYSIAWSKEYREMDRQTFLLRVSSFMENWQFIQMHADSIVVLPGVFRFCGTYPKDFVQKQNKKKTKVETDVDQISLF